MKPVLTYYELFVIVYNIVSSTLNISDYMKFDIFYLYFLFVLYGSYIFCIVSTQRIVNFSRF